MITGIVIGAIAGLLIGTAAGILIAALAVAAAESDRRAAHMLDDVDLGGDE